MQRTGNEWLRNPDGSPGYEWNPVRGCNRGCNYCIVKADNRRVAGDIIETEKAFRENHPALFPDGQVPPLKEADIHSFTPTWLWSNFCREFPEDPVHIYVNSTSDINYWQTEWMESVLERIKVFPQHTFFFLTKNISTYTQFTFPPNCWLGISVDTQERINSYQRVHRSVREKEGNWFTNRFFIVIEPMLDLIWNEFLYMADWIIIGPETGDRAERVIPKKIWIEIIKHACSMKLSLPGKGIVKRQIPLFMRDNLKTSWWNELVQEFPVFKQNRVNGESING